MRGVPLLKKLILNPEIWARITVVIYMGFVVNLVGFLVMYALE